MTAIEQKREKEKKVVNEMITLYCKRNHKKERGNDTLCPSCQELRDYSVARSEHCPFMEHKNFCANCKVHCYKPVMRERIRKVMRFSGPRMLLYHPCLTIWHLICSIKEKREIKSK